MNKDEIVAKLQVLLDQEFAIHKEICDLEAQLAAMKAPFAIGDEISFRHGKKRIRGIVREILPWAGSYSLRVQRVLKDGSHGSNVDVYTFHAPAKVAA